MDSFALLLLSSALALQGDLEEARAALDRFQGRADGATIASLQQSHAWLGPGFERILEGLRLAGLPEN